MKQADTKERILDAAEFLFARDGFHFASMRAITSEAGVNLSAVNYHFGSKETLLEEVLTRRLLPLNAIRRERLEGVRELAQSEGRPPRPEEVLRAFVVPTVQFCCQSKGAENFSTLVGRSMAEPDDTVRNVFLQHIMPLFAFLFELLQQSMPELDIDTVFWRVHFSIGSTSHTMRLLGKLELMPDGMNRDIDIDRLIEELLAFIIAGVKQ